MNTDLQQQEQLILGMQSLFEGMDKPGFDPAQFDGLYDREMEFQDSFHHIHGLDDFKNYCASLYQNVDYCRFSFHSRFVQSEQAMLRWTMDYAHPRLNSGNNIQLQGCSFVRFNDKVVYHRDYFDGGQLLYEHVPLLGKVIGFLKKRMA